MTWTDDDGIVHAVHALPEDFKTIVQASVEHAEKALEDQQRQLDALRIEGRPTIVRPAKVDTVVPDYSVECGVAPTIFLSAWQLDEDPNPVTCLACIAHAPV